MIYIVNGNASKQEPKVEEMVPFEFTLVVRKQGPSTRYSWYCYRPGMTNIQTPWSATQEMPKIEDVIKG